MKIVKSSVTRSFLVRFSPFFERVTDNFHIFPHYSATVAQASFPRIFFRKSKIFIFLTFNMYGLSQIFVRFEASFLRKKKKKIEKKVIFFLTFYIYVLSQISVRSALRGFVFEKKNEKKVKFSFF